MTLDWLEVWQAVAGTVEVHVRAGRGHLLTEDAVRFALIAALEEHGVSPADIRIEVNEPLVEGKLDLVVGDPPSGIVELKFPRDPRTSMPPDTMTLGEMLKDSSGLPVSTLPNAGSPSSSTTGCGDTSSDAPTSPGRSSPVARSQSSPEPAPACRSPLAVSYRRGATRLRSRRPAFRPSPSRASHSPFTACPDTRFAVTGRRYRRGDVMANKAPTAQELTDCIPEVEWSLRHIGAHFWTARLADHDGRDDVAQAAFDGALLHLRAILEFLNDSSHLGAADYIPSWTIGPAATAVALDRNQLRRTLNEHAAHLSRGRATQAPPAVWSLLDEADKVLQVFGHFLAAFPKGDATADALSDDWAESATQLARARAV